jgi:repressor LexA
MRELTFKQQRVMEFIRKRITRNIPPTMREIAKEMNFSSTGTVRDYLAVLERKGFIRRNKNKSRAIELMERGLGKIPIVGSIAAGSPDIAYEDIEGYIDCEDLFLGRLSYSDVFALKVKGDSMIDAGILEGDVAIIKKQPTANNKDVVAALISNSEATLKIYRLKDNLRFLEPANKRYKPIWKDFTILGKLLVVIRKY